MRDFTLEAYYELLEKIKYKGYHFCTFSDYIDIHSTNNHKPLVILRHDIDKLPMNSLAIAQIENELNIQSTFYFRMMPKIFDEEIIRTVADLGHEIGYHYETLDTSGGNLKNAYQEFCRNLEIFRKIYPVRTICMHGSPISRFDNKLLWLRYNYRELGIIGEPYYDIDFNEFAYLTDTGRRWNGNHVSVRDKVNSKYSFNFKTTFDIINNIEKLPDKVLLTIHPQRWFSSRTKWTGEYIIQNTKNIIKYFIARWNEKKVTPVSDY